ncbi:HD family phosphohydrolase [Salinibacter altiplanensis]|uniref:HD family phosphohydrolase n=1 Tax=Salinibacter altiplanensis TaxID=1803181 RepID=UPI000C9F8A3A|nr:HDIG domain-containing metalloprotein [Salinibacter altiplanensis]
MRLLELLGWSRRAPQPVGDDLETGDDSEATAAWRGWALRGGLFLGLVALTVAAFPRGDFYEYTVEVGDTWSQSTLSAPFKFPVYLDPERVEARRDTVRDNTPPYFQEVQGASRQLVQNRDTLRRQLNRILGTYASYRYHRQQGESETARQDSLEYVRRRRNAQVTLSASEWEYLASQHADEVQDLRSASRRPSDQTSSRLYGRLIDAAFEVGGQLLSLGVMNRPRDSVRTDRIIVRNQRDQTQRRADKNNLYGLNEAFDYAERQLREQFSANREHSRIASSFFRAIFVPSLQYLREDTMQERERRAKKVTAIQGGVDKGEPIVRTGQRVTQEIKRKLTSLERAKSDQLGSSIVLKQLGGEGLFTLLGFGFLFFYLYLLRPNIWSKNRDLILMSVVLALIIALYGIAIRSPWSLYVVPVPLASVLLTIVFNSRIALIGTLVLALTGGQMLGLDLEYTSAAFFAGAFGIFSVRDIKNRGQFFVSGGLAFVGYTLVLLATWLYLDLSFERVVPDLAYAAIASAITITSSLFLWALERTFDITTDLTLLELSDTNRPLLKELSLRAPGSFNHTLQVANLAEAAADRIGAHALLTRVGALYHDIGKMKKPEYFVENQRTMSNPHDELKPRMSALIIASHVKEGLEMGTDDGLPAQVHKFIPMHHGTARIEYFYQKALSQAADTDQSVLESEFRYPGPKPDSKETGILMLADSVEAASRSLEDPSPRRLENLIDLLFSERIDDGQLDNTDLTFRDLRRIKDTFLKMLLGIYHVRVKYPDQEDTSAEPDFEVVSLRAEQPYMNVSIVYSQDAWGAWIEPEASSAERSRKEPRPQLADASPHSSPSSAGGRMPATPNGRGSAPVTKGPAATESEDEEASSEEQ